MDERLGAFLERVLKIMPEHFVTEVELSKLYDRMYPPARITRILDKMRHKAFNEKEEPIVPTDLSFPVNYLARNGFIDHKPSEYLMEESTKETSLYRISDMGRSYLVSLRPAKK